MSHPGPRETTTQLAVKFAARTDVGRTRDHNEDNFLVDRRLRLYIVCDGLGGHHGGEIASATAVNVVREHLRESRELLELLADSESEQPEVIELLREAVERANDRVHERGRLAQSARGMGTTLSLLLVLGARGYIAHVGDTRVYRLRDQILDQITEDHSLLNELQRGLQVSAEAIEAVGDKLKNQVTRAVGVNPTVEADVFSVALQPGDRYLLASDGLHGPVDDGQLRRLLLVPDLDQVAARCIISANDAGGPDNITAIILEIEASEEMREVSGRSRQRDALTVARSHPLFRGFSDSELARILDGAEELHVPARGAVLRVGDHLLGLFILVHGTVRVEDARTQNAPLELGAGVVLCEDALIAERTATFSVFSGPGDGARLVLVPRAIFLSTAVQKPLLLLKVSQAIIASLSARLSEAATVLGSARPLVHTPSAPTRIATRPAPRPATDRPPSAPKADRPPPNGQAPRLSVTVPQLPAATIRPRAPSRSPSEQLHHTLPAIPSIRSPGLGKAVPPPIPGSDDRGDG